MEQFTQNYLDGFRDLNPRNHGISKSAIGLDGDLNKPVEVLGWPKHGVENLEISIETNMKMGIGS